MKKLLFVAAAVVLTFSSCLKGNDSYKDYENVRPGTYIYSAGADQNRFASLPADMCVRLAMLVAQAEIQFPGGTDDFSNIMSGTVNVKKKLFGENCTVTRDGDNYVITFENDAPVSGFLMSGKITVKTNGQRLIIDTDEMNPWEVSYTGHKIKFDVDGYRVTMNYANAQSVISIHNAADGSYVIQSQNMRMNLDENAVYSDWGGRFILTPPAESLAYSLCTGKQFKYTGAAMGPTAFTVTTANTSTDISYSLKDGVYDQNGIRSGIETCTLQDFIVDPNLFPSKVVTMTWSTGETGQRTRVLSYNGYTMSY